MCGSLSSSLAAVLYDDAAVLYDCHNRAVMIRGTFRHDIQLYTVVNLTFFCNPAVGHALPTDGECALMLVVAVVVAGAVVHNHPPPAGTRCGQGVNSANCLLCRM